MRTDQLVALGLFLPLLGTALGAAAALALPAAPAGRGRGALGFAAGVMLAASVWSLLLPAMDAAERLGLIPWLPAVAGFLAGTWGMAGLCRLAARRHGGCGETRRVFLLLCSVTLHNIPEGMAVGVAFASALAGDASLAGAMALALGIAVQNLPEGGIISLPLAQADGNRRRALWLGTLSGAVEPVAAALALLLAAWMRAALPWALSFAAGCMFFVVAEELLAVPEGEKSATGSAAAGFALMLLLDAALGA